jgi:hypothetical protein
MAINLGALFLLLASLAAIGEAIQVEQRGNAGPSGKERIKRRTRSLLQGTSPAAVAPSSASQNSTIAGVTEKKKKPKPEEAECE